MLLLLWFFCLPRPLFQTPTSTIVTDKNGRLLGARIAADGQWRFPQTDTVPEKFASCIIAFEDKNFYWHPGFDPFAFVRAIRQNIAAGHVVSGGSTLTMQTIRMASDNPPRTVVQKIKELFLATRLEFRFSKKEILALYASNAPFGGNVVGLEAAVWRYFGKKSSDLSWAQAATLAVLPNSPGLIHVGRNRAALRKKRNRLLAKLHKNGILSKEDYELSSLEALPDKPLRLPQVAPHLLDRLIAEQGKGKHFQVTLDADLQRRCTEVLARHQPQLRGLGVHNAAALVLDVATNEVLAYVGNVAAGVAHGAQVDVINAPRSSGSILKPYFYAFAQQGASLTPRALMADIPTQYGAYAPQNYAYSFDGAVSAKRALARSLNVPWVRHLEAYGTERLHFQLKKMGFSTLTYPSNHYGLSLILGGAEVKLFDVARAYAGMARTLGTFYERDGQYSAHDFRAPVFLYKKNTEVLDLQPDAPLLSAGVVWSTFEAMREVERPNELGEWELFDTQQTIAWKTGTSFGFRDAWAAGVTPRYVVAVWAGNADGEGRPGLIGVQAAAPILFDIFSYLPSGMWFLPPYDDLTRVPICVHSGLRATAQCSADSLWTPNACLTAAPCSYCQVLHLDASGTYQVHSGCAPTASMRHEPWFVLPTVQEYFYKSKHPSYRIPPPVRTDCIGTHTETAQKALRLIYPKQNAEIYIPKELDGERGKAIFEAAHRRPNATIYWHLDEQFLGETQTIHQMGVQAAAGTHTMTLVDDEGERSTVIFKVVNPT